MGSCLAGAYQKLKGWSMIKRCEHLWLLKQKMCIKNTFLWSKQNLLPWHGSSVTKSLGSNAISWKVSGITFTFKNKLLTVPLPLSLCHTSNLLTCNIFFPGIGSKILIMNFYLTEVHTPIPENLYFTEFLKQMFSPKWRDLECWRPDEPNRNQSYYNNTRDTRYWF